MPLNFMMASASGSMDAAASAMASMRRGEVGRIIEKTRIATAFHDTCIVGTCAGTSQAFRRPMPNVFARK